MNRHAITYPEVSDLDRRGYQHALLLTLETFASLVARSLAGKKVTASSRTESPPLQRPKADFGLHDVGGDRSAYPFLLYLQSAVIVNLEF